MMWPLHSHHLIRVVTHTWEKQRGVLQCTFYWCSVQIQPAFIVSTGFTVFCRKNCYSLRAGILVCNFTFHARDSKPESLFSRTIDTILQLHLYHLTHVLNTHEKKLGVFLQYFLLVVAYKFNQISSFVEGRTPGDRRTRAWELVIWFWIPHLMQEIPNQIVSSLGRPSMWALVRYVIRDSWEE